MDISQSITYGVYQNSHGEAVECSVNDNHSLEGYQNIASFGVFRAVVQDDVHAASLCAKRLHRNIVRNYKAVINGTEKALQSRDKEFLKLESLPLTDLRDAILCESIRLSCNNMNDELNTKKLSGCTSLNVVLSFDADAKSIRIMCANIGDSRCVLFTPKLEDTPSTMTSPPMIGPLHSFCMSEDHKFSSARERTRVSSKLQLQDASSWIHRRTSVWSPLPARPTGHDAAETFISGYPDNDRLDTCTILENTVKRSDSLRTIDSSINSSLNTSEDSMLGDDTTAAKPKANVTRILGNRLYPRSCVPVPDVTAVTVQPHECARLVIATEAFWSAVSFVDVSDAAGTYFSPQKLSQFFAKRAEEVSAAAGINSKETIAVVVVDVNPYQLYQHTLDTAGVDCGACIIA